MNLSSLPGAHNPQRLPYKFITRNLQTSISPKIVFRNARIKSFFVKNFHQKEEYCDETKDLISKFIKNKSCHKTLSSISLLSISQPSLQNNLKLCKNLNKLHLATGKMKMKKVTIILRKLPRNLQTICLKRVVPNPETDKTFYEFAKTIFRFPKLKVFDRDFGSSGNFHSTQNFQRELKVYSQFASRLKKLVTINFGFSLFEILQFQGAIKEKFVYAGINGLIMNLQLDSLFKRVGIEVFGSGNHYLYADIPYDLNDQEHISQIRLNDPNIKEEEINQELMMKKRMREEIELFFSFELFPNLKRLEINQDLCLYSLTSFVGHGFKYLKKLQELSIVFHRRSHKNIIYFFKQLSHLPLLKKLSLNLPVLKNEEWVFLEQFLKGQEKLESFSLCIPDLLIAFYPAQEIYLENTIKSLSNKPLLKSLELKSPLWPLKAISQGLSWLKMENQLHMLKIEGNEIVAASDKELVKGVEGLCSFINSQKDSLKIIEISIPFVVQSQILNPILEAISGLNQLRELEIFVSYKDWYEIKYTFDNVRQRIEKDIAQKKFNISQTWASDFAKNLLKIKNLESFTLGFDVLNESQELLEGFLDIMNTLPRLKRLRKVHIASRALLPLQQQIVNSVLQLKNIREITFYLHDESWGDNSCFDNLRKVVESLNKKQSIRSDLMF